MGWLRLSWKRSVWCPGDMVRGVVRVSSGFSPGVQSQVVMQLVRQFFVQ